MSNSGHDELQQLVSSCYRADVEYLLESARRFEEAGNHERAASERAYAESIRKKLTRSQLRLIHGGVA